MKKRVIGSEKTIMRRAFGDTAEYGEDLSSYEFRMKRRLQQKE
jgi:hypothetical protein